MEINKRRGCIRISKELLDELNVDFLKLFFGNFYPINIENVGFDDRVYYGYSEQFDESIEGESNQYDAIINTREKTIVFKKI